MVSMTALKAAEADTAGPAPPPDCPRLKARVQIMMQTNSLLRYLQLRYHGKHKYALCTTDAHLSMQF